MMNAGGVSHDGSLDRMLTYLGAIMTLEFTAGITQIDQTNIFVPVTAFLFEPLESINCQ